MDPRNGRIDGPDGVVHVTPKAMEVLLCLVNNPTKLIERDKLIEAGWGPGEGHEESLTRCIAELRHALGDHYDEPTFIQTIPRRGYRLVAPVLVDSEEFAEQSASDRNDQPSPTFWGELKRREVVRTSLAYAAAVWLVIEVVSVLAPIFGMPEWAMRTLVVIAFIGFPIVAALSWTLQLTPSGLAIDMPIRGGTLITDRKIDLIIIATLMIAVSFLLYREFRPVEPIPGIGSPQSVAVLPFDNLSNNAEDEFLSDGLAEELLNLLAQTADLDVTSRKASFYYKGKDVPLKSIVSALGVRNIVEGSIQRSGERIRITVQLVDAQSMMHRWSESYDAREPDFIEIRDTIAREVAAELKTVMTERGERIIARDAETERSAYLYYLKARGELRKEHTDETLGNAEDLLNEAVSLDPDFAKARAALCDTYLALYIVAGREQSYFDKAESACQHALALDGGLAEVHIALGNLYRESGDFGAAELEFERALSLDARSYDAVYGMALTREAQGRIESAEARFEELARLEPGYWQAYNAIGHFYYAQGRFAEAAYNFRRASVLAPGNALAFNNLGAAQYMQGDFPAAAKAWGESARIRPSNLVLSNIGLAAYYSGEYDKAVAMQQEAIAESPEDFRIWGRLADAHRQAGNTAQANDAYEKALAYSSLAMERNPSDEETLRYLSLYYSHTGDSAAAIRAIERARVLQPESSRVHYFASKVYLVAGNTARAEQELEAALSKGYSLAIALADPDLRPLRDSGRIELLATEQRI